MGGGLTEAGCWAHVRRKIFDVHAATGSALAAEALERIGRSTGSSATCTASSPMRATRERQTRSKPLAEALKAFAETSLAQVPGRSDLAKALRYMLARWPALMRAFDDGRLALDNNAAERALRCVAVGRKNYLFAGSEPGAERAAAFYSLIETAKMNGLDPRVTCATCSRASPITRPSDWPICCLGTGCQPVRPSRPPDLWIRHRALTGGSWWSECQTRPAEPTSRFESSAPHTQKGAVADAPRHHQRGCRSVASAGQCDSVSLGG